jgi:Xaa-Pro aminopeptidase
MTSTTVTDRITTYSDRVQRLRLILAEEGLDALVVTNPDNRRYLSGFTGHDSGADSAGALVITGGKVLLITDGRYIEQAKHEVAGISIKKREAALAPLVAELLTEAQVTSAGFEANHVTVAQLEDWKQALADKKPSVSLRATRTLVERQRVIKDAEEIAAIERAVAITDETFTHICRFLRAGMTERRIAQEIERYMEERGAEGLAFDSIVASGPNAALPHAVPGNREIGEGEPITIDMGAKLDGYCADMTRTICLGDPSPEMAKTYALVLRAQETCLEGLRPGMTGKQADALARDVFVAAAREDQYLHGTGHGLGLEIHEDPRLSKYGEEFILAPGMAITIEPGLYVPDVGGVRIEDTAVVTEDGIRILTTSHKRFQLRKRQARPRE